MIDRIEVQRILVYIVEAEEKKKAKVQEKRYFSSPVRIFSGETS